jgi:hypothetical protein
MNGAGLWANWAGEAYNSYYTSEVRLYPKTLSASSISVGLMVPDLSLDMSVEKIEKKVYQICRESPSSSKISASSVYFFRTIGTSKANLVYRVSSCRRMSVMLWDIPGWAFAPLDNYIYFHRIVEAHYHVEQLCTLRSHNQRVLDGLHRYFLKICKT